MLGRRRLRSGVVGRAGSTAMVVVAMAPGSTVTIALVEVVSVSVLVAVVGKNDGAVAARNRPGRVVEWPVIGILASYCIYKQVIELTSSGHDGRHWIGSS